MFYPLGSVASLMAQVLCLTRSTPKSDLPGVHLPRASGHFLAMHEAGASMCIGHCPISWFSLPSFVPVALLLALLHGALFGAFLLGPPCGATIR